MFCFIGGVIEVEGALDESLDGVPKGFIAPFSGVGGEFEVTEEACVGDRFFFFLSGLEDRGEEVISEEFIDTVGLFLFWIGGGRDSHFLSAWFHAAANGSFVDNNFVDTFFGEVWEDVFDLGEGLSDESIECAGTGFQRDGLFCDGADSVSSEGKGDTVSGSKFFSF